jgi:hypothetical protein
MSASNTFYTPSGQASFNCGRASLSLSDWQKLGYDLGSAVASNITTAQIVELAHSVLDWPQ